MLPVSFGIELPFFVGIAEAGDFRQHCGYLCPQKDHERCPFDPVILYDSSGFLMGTRIKV
jgi:hypothetical protein